MIRVRTFNLVRGESLRANESGAIRVESGLHEKWRYLTLANTRMQRFSARAIEHERPSPDNDMQKIDAWFLYKKSEIRNFN